jgi:hypothetical protein
VILARDMLWLNWVLQRSTMKKKETAASAQTMLTETAQPHAGTCVFQLQSGACVV